MPSPARLAAQNAESAITDAAGTVRRLGFSPAFLDCDRMIIHPSRFFDGTPRAVPLPRRPARDAVLLRLPSGRVVHAKTLVYGFERGGFFYTRTAAARACAQWDVASTPPESRLRPSASGWNGFIRLPAGRSLLHWRSAFRRPALAARRLFSSVSQGD